MAIGIPGGLVSEIYGSIGGTNFYKHGPWQIIRNKAIPKRSTSMRQALVKEAWTRARAYATANYYGTIKTLVDKQADFINKTRHGISYKITGYQQLMNLGYFAFFYRKDSPRWLDNTKGTFYSPYITVELKDAPSYIWLTKDATVLEPFYILFWWGYPSGYYCAGKPSNYPYFIRSLFAPDHKIEIPATEGPRISGIAKIWFKWRVIGFDDRASRINYGYATKTNWQ